MPKNPNKPQEFKLQPRHYKIIELLIYRGLSQKEAAEQVGVTEWTVSEWINHNKIFQKHYDDELKKAESSRQRIYKTVARRAVQKLIELMDCGTSHIELNAAKEILDRAGDKPSEKIEFSKNTGEIIAELEAYMDSLPNIN